MKNYILLSIAMVLTSVLNTSLAAAMGDSEQPSYVQVMGQDSVREWLLAGVKPVFETLHVDSECVKSGYVQYLKSDDGIFNQSLGMIPVAIAARSEQPRGDRVHLYVVYATPNEVSRHRFMLATAVRDSLQEKIKVGSSVVKIGSCAVSGIQR